jgi:hypothetical protein
MKLKTLLVITFLMGCCSCVPFFSTLGKVPEVTAVHPSGRVQPGECITVQFSCDMDKTSVESALRLGCSMVPVNGSFAWNSPKEVAFFPDHINASRKYTLELAFTARSSKGIPLARGYRHFFNLPTEASPLMIESLEPNPEDLVISPAAEFLISFNQAVDRSTFYSACSLSPNVEARYEWNQDETQVRIIPQFGLTPQLYYQLEISTECTSAEGVPLASPVQRRYQVAGIDTLPVESFCWISNSGQRIVEATPESHYHAAQDEVFSLRFSEAIPRALHSAAVSLQPDPGIDFQWSPDNRQCTLRTATPLHSGTVFRLAIGSESYYLQWDGPGAETVSLAGVAYCNNTAAATAIFRRIYLNDLLDFESSEEAALELAFSHAPEAEIAAVDLMRALRLSATNGSAALRLSDLQEIESAKCAELNTLNPDSLFRLTFSIQRYPAAGRLCLHLALDREINMSYNL